MKRYSYEGILRAVGQVLDEAEARSFSIEDVENGLVVRARRADGPDLTINFELADLVELLESRGLAEGTTRHERAYNEGTLADFLARHERELVPAGA
jgi:hypothetical protein